MSCKPVGKILSNYALIWQICPPLSSRHVVDDHHVDLKRLSQLLVSGRLCVMLTSLPLWTQYPLLLRDRRSITMRLLHIIEVVWCPQRRKLSFFVIMLLCNIYCWLNVTQDNSLKYKVLIRTLQSSHRGGLLSFFFWQNSIGEYSVIRHTLYWSYGVKRNPCCWYCVSLLNNYPNMI